MGKNRHEKAIGQRRQSGYSSRSILSANRKAWKNEKSEAQWTYSLETYVFPHIGNVKVNEITGPMIRGMLAMIWLSKPETARRVRQRVGTILDWAYASGYREHEAPMRAITKGLPRQPKREGHFAAMPYDKVPGFIPSLRERESFSRLALEFAILTAARSGEVRGATWSEVDLDLRLWTIPKERMKANREHVVPLCQRAILIIERCADLRLRDCPIIFPGSRGNQKRQLVLLRQQTLSTDITRSRRPLRPYRRVHRPASARTPSSSGRSRNIFRQNREDEKS